MFQSVFDHCQLQVRYFKEVSSYVLAFIAFGVFFFSYFKIIK